MPNFNVLDAYGSVVTIASSTVGSAERQIVQVSVMGALPVTISGNPSVSGQVGASVIGTVPIVQSGTLIASMVSTVPSSVIVGASIFGQIPAGTAPIGSIATLQGTNPWIITANNNSIIGVIQGSVAAAISGSVVSYPLGTIVTSLVSTIPSSVIVGASVFGNVGIHGNPSISGTVGASIIGTAPVNVELWNGNAPPDTTTGSDGLNNGNTGLVSNAFNYVFNGATWDRVRGSSAIGMLVATRNLASVVQGIADLRVVQGASVAIISGAGAGIRNYIEHIQVVNFGSASVLVVIADNTTSVLGWTIAPAGGGSNYDCFYKGAANSPITASINGTASVLVSAQGFTGQ